MLFFLFPRVLTKGEIIAPLDLAYQFSPWRTSNVLGIEGGFGALSDQWDQILPNLQYIFRQLREGSVPAYTDKVQNGTPLFWLLTHEGKVAPLLLLSLVLPFSYAWTAFLVARLLVGGMFFYRYLRGFGLQTHSSLVATIVFCFNSYPVQSFGITMSTQYFMIPILLYAIERILCERSVFWLLLLPILGSQLLLSGYPPTAAYIGLFLSVYSIFRLLQLRPRSNSPICGLAVSAITATLLSAPALLASYDFFQRFDWSYREAYWQSGIPLWRLTSYLIPFSWGGTANSWWIRECVYLGVLPLLVLLVGVFVPKKPALSKFLWCYFALELCITYNVFDILELYRHVPLIRSAMPNNHIILVTSLASILLAFSLDALVKFRATRGLLVTTFAGAGFFLWAYLSRNEILASSVELAQQLTLAIAGLFAIVVLLSLRSRPALSFSRLSVLFIVGFDLIGFGRGMNSTVPREAFYAETPGIRYLKQHSSDGKIFLLDSEFLANAPLAFGLRTIAGRGFFTRPVKDLYRLISPRAFDAGPTSAIFPSTRATRIESKLFDAFSIEYVVSSKFTDLSKPLPESYVFHQCAFNNTLEVKPASTVCQSFTPRSSASADTVAVITQRRTSSTSAPLRFSLFHNQQLLLQSLSPIQEPNDEALRFLFPKQLFSLGGSYQACFSVPESSLPGVELAWMRGWDIVEDGALTVDHALLDGELAMVLYQERSATTTVSGDKFTKVYDDDLRIWRNSGAFPRAWVVPNLEYMEDRDFIGHVEQDDSALDFRRYAYVSTSIKDAQRVSPYDRSDQALVVNRHTDDSFQEYELRSESGGWLVISDNFDPGWEATVDDLRAPVIRVNLNMRAVPVPPGIVTVKLRYAPVFLTVGFALAALGAAAQIVLALVWLRK